MLISVAHAAAEVVPAATAAAAAAPSTGQAFAMNMGLIFLLVIMFYLLLIRPQQKRFREHANMLSDLRKGDRIVTQGGVIATIDKLGDDNEVVLEIAPGVKMQAYRTAIATKYQPTPTKTDTTKVAE